jgi:acetolactate synthase-1/3 small subunit
MAMRRGLHTSRVLKALGTVDGAGASSSDDVRLSPEEILPNEFEDVHEEEE